MHCFVIGSFIFHLYRLCHHVNFMANNKYGDANVLHRITDRRLLSGLFRKYVPATTRSPARSPLLDVSCHILMTAFLFGADYVRKSNRKYAVRFLTCLMKMEGLVARMGPDTWQSIVSLHQCTGVSSIRSHIAPAGNEDVPSNGNHNGCRQMEDISLYRVFPSSVMMPWLVDRWGLGKKKTGESVVSLFSNQPSKIRQDTG